MTLDRKFYQSVLRERHGQLKALISSAKDQTKPVELDQTKMGRLSRIDAMQQQAMASETERRRKNDLKRVEAAIKRLDDETFGFCINCEEPIPRKRLEFDPASATCVRCASV